MKLNPSSDNAGDFQQIINEMGQLPHLSLDNALGFLLNWVCRLVETKDMQGVEDRREGIAQLMGKHCEEFVLALVKFGQRFRLFVGLLLQPDAFADVDERSDRAGDLPLRVLERREVYQHG